MKMFDILDIIDYLSFSLGHIWTYDILLKPLQTTTGLFYYHYYYYLLINKVCDVYIMDKKVNCATLLYKYVKSSSKGIFESSQTHKYVTATVTCTFIFTEGKS